MQRIVLAVILFIMWLFLVWPFGPAGVDHGSIYAGIAVAILVGAYLGEIVTEDIYKLLNPRRVFYFLLYLPVLAFWCLLANLDVMYRVLHPARPINPGIVKVKTKLRSRPAQVILANSITLTPGTLSVDLDPEAGELYIHWIDVKSTDVAEASRHIVERFEGLLARVFE